MQANREHDGSNLLETSGNIDMEDLIAYSLYVVNKNSTVSEKETESNPCSEDTHQDRAPPFQLQFNLDTNGRT